ncbi:calcium/proton exchanger [Aureobasidium namibiae CBS 147.97]|uniref:Calcium/proton exchanger n=1 Tax=Aureobasidium namibiae CBS 147.97 TaxID=1043004 RepID=A0A074W7K0_9PEZI|nr:calcium/proton exchanger [Aureobasidium namibiae CBS 147.97]KEQ69095.1 calcium/proton exchanger [Aureobasidium namibiae CBS 147.97]
MGEPSDPSLLDRIRSWAKHHASDRSKHHNNNTPQRSDNPTLPTTTRDLPDAEKAGPSTSPTNGTNHVNNFNTSHHDNTTFNNTADKTSPALPGPAPPPEHVKSEYASSNKPTLGDGDGTANVPAPKPSIPKRAKAGSVRFFRHTYDALTHSWINLLLVAVPAGIIAKALNVNPSVVFALNAVAIIPLAGMLAYATEVVASRLGDTLGALMNVSFGNAVELIIFVIALVKNEIRIVQASLVGSILSNLLLIMGMAFLLGGLRFQEQIYNSTITQMSACLLSLSVVSLVLPTAFHASFSDSATADDRVLKVSRGTSVILLIIYVLYLLFQLKSHAYLYESTPQQIIDEESHPGILADMLGSSSSSDSSSSSSSSDSDSSSHTTSKRIRRAFRHRRRRKSSASTTTTPSVISAPSVERAPSYQSDIVQPQRRLSALGAINSGDEADTDGDLEMRGAHPLVRDFVDGPSDEHQQQLQFQDAKPERKQKKKHKKRHHYKRHGSHDEKQSVDDNSSVRKQGKRPAKESSPKPFGIRQLSSRQVFPRPTLPKMLSQNVFVSPPPTTGSPVPGAPMVPRTGVGAIRRTNSLPDRLNRQNTPTSTQQENLPPYPRTPDGEPENEEEDEEKHSRMSRTAAVVLLLIATALVAVCAEFMVDAIPEMIEATPVSQAFIGLIILPIVSNAAEHVTAVTVAAKNKMDLSIGVSVGSSIQIALFVTPLVVILGWIIGRDMSLYFTLFETISLFVTAFVVNFLVLDGRSNYLEGALLIAAYVIIAVSAFYYPDGADASSLAGSNN